MLPTPTPIKSRLTSGGSLGSVGNDLVVAAVCTITTTEIMRLSDSRLVRRLTETTGIASVGAVTEIVPSTLTPRFSSRSSTTAAAANARPINAPGIRASICSDRAMIARTPRPMTSVKPLVSPRCSANVTRRWSIGPSGPGSPRIAGNCEIKMCAEMPARKPIVTGIDNRSAIQPRRKMPDAASISPTISASAAASVA